MAESALGRFLESITYSPIASVVTDARKPDHPIETVNDAFCKLTGYDALEVVGRNPRFLQGEQTEAWIREEIRVAIQHRRSAFVDILNFKRDGTPFRNGMMITPLLDDHGELAFFFGSQLDLGSDAKQQFSARRFRATALVRDLAPRQRQVLAGMAKGLLSKQIAHKMGVTEKTVQMHRSQVLGRLGVRTTAEAIRIGVEAGL